MPENINPKIIENLQANYGETKVEVEKFLGDLHVSEKPIILCDPLAPSYIVKFNHKIIPGAYPVYSLKIQKENRRTSFSAVISVFDSEAEVDKWQLVQDSNTNFFASDAGTGCMASSEGWDLFSKRNKEIFTLYKSDIYNYGKDLSEYANNGFMNYFPYPEKNKDWNVVMFGTGGDGSFYSFVGLNKKEDPVCLLTDLTGNIPFWEKIFNQTKGLS